MISYSIALFYLFLKNKLIKPHLNIINTTPPPCHFIIHSLYFLSMTSSLFPFFLLNSWLLPPPLSPLPFHNSFILSHVLIHVPISSSQPSTPYLLFLILNPLSPILHFQSSISYPSISTFYLHTSCFSHLLFIISTSYYLSFILSLYFLSFVLHSQPLTPCLLFSISYFMSLILNLPLPVSYFQLLCPIFLLLFFILHHPSLISISHAMFLVLSPPLFVPHSQFPTSILYFESLSFISSPSSPFSTPPCFQFSLLVLNLLSSLPTLNLPSFI